MTLATGKSGLYRYYKCSTRMAKGGSSCRSRNLTAEAFDRKTLDALADLFFTPARINAILTEMRKTDRESKEYLQTRINLLNRQKQNAETGLNRPYDAIEKGTIALDDLLQKRLEALNISREALQAELTRLHQSKAAAIEQVLPSMVERFSKGTGKKLEYPTFAKRYLQLFVDDIIVTDCQATIRGDKAKQASVINADKKLGSSEEVPSFMRAWRAGSDKFGHWIETLLVA